MKKKIIVIIILMLLVGVASLTLYHVSFKEETVVNNDDTSILEETKDEEIKEPLVEETSLTLIMGGDAVIHGAVYLNNKIDGKFDFDYPLSEIKEIVEPYDLAYYNQETILGGSELGLSHYPEFNSPQEVGDSFIKAGFNLVSLANNHTLDGYYSKGSAYVNSSTAYWQNKYKENNIISAGSYSSKESRDEIVIGEKNDITYALLSYTYGTNDIVPDENEQYLVNYIDKEIIKNDVNMYRDKVDLLMVAMHWGEEYTFDPTAAQKDLAKYLADLDVDIVIGNHAHVIEPIEWIDDTLVIYALGNIISAQYITGNDMYSLGFGTIVKGQDYTVETLTGMLTSVKVNKKTINGESSITISDLKTQLIYTDYKDRWKVYPYAKLNDDILPKHEEYFAYFKDILNNGTEIDIQ